MDLHRLNKPLTDPEFSDLNRGSAFFAEEKSELVAYQRQESQGWLAGEDPYCETRPPNVGAAAAGAGGRARDSLIRRLLPAWIGRTLLG